jgi:pyrroloquinoline-quinone synthase
MYYTIEDLHKQLEPIRGKYPLTTHPFVKKFETAEYSADQVRAWATKMLPGSNRFNTSFLRAISMLPELEDRIILLKNSFTEHGRLKAEDAHINLLVRFMRAVDCPVISIYTDDGSSTAAAMAFKKFPVEIDEPIVGILARFLAFETALPSLFSCYIKGLRVIFPKLTEHDLEYFSVHIEADPDHESELLEVISRNIKHEADIMIVKNNYELMYSQLVAFFDYEYRELERLAAIPTSQIHENVISMSGTSEDLTVR